MRKVTENTVSAFLAGIPRTVGCTTTDGKALYLHGSRIAWKEGDAIKVCFCGFPTNVTKERINAVAEMCQGRARFCHKGGRLHIDHAHGDVRPFDSTETYTFRNPTLKA